MVHKKILQRYEAKISKQNLSSSSLSSTNFIATQVLNKTSGLHAFNSSIETNWTQTHKENV